MPTGVLLMTGTADAESCQWDLLKVPPNYLREEEVALGLSEENCTYYRPGGGGGKKIYGPEGSQALPALPFDKNTVNMEASVEQ